MSRLLSVLHQVGNTTLDGASYTYDNAGNRTAKTDYLASVTSNYSYDNLYQLTQVTQGSSTTESYSYDAVGSRLSSLGVSPYAYNSSNELTSTPSATYTYDHNGNTTTKTDSSGTTTYNWDTNNQLTSVALPGSGGTVSFKYDPFGRRIQKSSSSGTTNYLYDGANLVEEVDNSGGVQAKYTQGIDIDQLIALFRSSTTSYYETDGLGSISSLTNSSALLTNTYTYDSFGNSTSSAGTITDYFRYTGREYDSETGLYYYRARYYDEQAGRFASEDPSQFQAGINFFAYVGNSPTGFTDPLGLECKPKCFAQLKYRYATLGENHAFWWIQASDGHQYIISAGPSHSTYGYLNVWINQGTAGVHFPADNSGDAVAFNSGLSSDVCAQVDRLLAAANAFPNNTIDYWAWPGPNSNSVAHYLGSAGGFNPPQPPKTPAWSTPVPIPRPGH